MAKKKSATKRILFIILGLIGVLLILGVIGNATGLIGEKEQGTLVETAQAELRTVTQVVTASGKAQPEIEVVISPDVAGEIVELPVKEGDQVQRGDLLARIRADAYSAQVEQASAGVLQAQANEAQRRADLLNAELELNRQKELFDKGLIPESDYQRTQTQYEVAKAGHEAAQYSVQSAQARLRELREQLSKTAIYAPMDGTVSLLNVELGERVVGSNMMNGTDMMHISRLNQMEMEVDINENDVVNVALGDTAAIEIDAYPERQFKGIVTEIANSARVTGAGSQEQVTNFPVKVRILDAHNAEQAYASADASGALVQQEVEQDAVDMPRFRPGMSGTVDISTHTMRNVIAVPIQSVTVRDFNKFAEKDSTATEEAEVIEEDLRRVIFVVVDGKAEMREVVTSISDDSHIVIRSGVAEGETVITGPYRAVSRTLEPDDAVRVDDNKGQRGPGPRVASR